MRFTFTVALLGLFCGATARAQLRLAAPVATTFSADAARAISYDLNRDNVPDLLVAGGGANKAVLLLGTASGRLSAPQYFPTTGFCGGVALGNANCDIYADVFLSDFGTGTGAVLVLPGQAGAAFGPAVSVAVTGNPQHLVAADFNRDGKTDFATVDKLTGSLQVRSTAGSCAPAYGPETAYATGSGPLSADLTRLADFNGDGLLDALVLNQASPSGQGLSLLLGVAGGTFGTVATFATGAGGPVDAAVSDLNGDNVPDVVLAYSDNSLGVFLGRGTAPMLGARVSYTLPAPALALTVADLDGDQLNDVVAVLATGEVMVLRGLGGGGLAAAVWLGQATVAGASAQLLAPDFNGDFRPDVAVISSGRVQVFMNTTGPLAVAGATASSGGITPNPAVGGVFRLSGGGLLANVRVTDLSGRAVAAVLQGDVVTLPGAAPGVYVVLWRAGDGPARRGKVEVR